MKSIGDEAELVAQRWLQRKGLKLLERQVACRFGEIDLVMQQGSSVVLVEVKYRQGALFDAFESVTAAKRRKLGLAARWLYVNRPQWQDMNWRFDVLALAGDLKSPEVEWLSAAFELPSA